MDWLWLCLGILLLIFWIGNKQQQARIKEARKFDVPKIHGEREFASEKQMKKAGLI